MIHLQARLEECNGEPNRLENLVLEDFRIIGAYIQIYNFIEFNCLRCIEMFALAGLLIGRLGRKPQRISISDLVPTIKKVVERMNSAVENTREFLAKLDEVESRRGFRNLFAYWAVRRIPNEDAIVLFSMDGFDRKQISGVDDALKDVAQTAIVDLADIRGLIVHVSDYERWMAAKTSEWHARLLPGRQPLVSAP